MEKAISLTCYRCGKQFKSATHRTLCPKCVHEIAKKIIKSKYAKK